MSLRASDSGHLPPLFTESVSVSVSVYNACCWSGLMLTVRRAYTHMYLYTYTFFPEKSIRFNKTIPTFFFSD